MVQKLFVIIGIDPTRPDPNADVGRGNRRRLHRFERFDVLFKRLVLIFRIPLRLFKFLDDVP